MFDSRFDHSNHTMFYFNSMEPNNNRHMFTDEAVDAFRSAINNDDFGPLSSIFDEPQLSGIRLQLGRNHGIGPEAQVIMDQAREVLAMLERGYG